jgi:hypothetical protein
MKADTDHHHSPDSRRAAAAGGRPFGIGPSRLALVVATAALTASALILFALDESEWPMFVLGLGGLLAGRMVGVPERHLALIAFGLTVFAWPIALFESPIPRATSTLAHIAVAALLAWALADPVRHRWPEAMARPWSPRWFLIPVLVLAIGVVWELGEWVGDALFETDLSIRPLDAVADLAADFAGAVAGLALRDRVLLGTRRQPVVESDPPETVLETDR